MTDTRVSLVRCDDYRPDLVYRKVKEAVDLVGTMSALGESRFGFRSTRSPPRRRRPPPSPTRRCWRRSSGW